MTPSSPHFTDEKTETQEDRSGCFALREPDSNTLDLNTELLSLKDTHEEVPTLPVAEPAMHLRHLWPPALVEGKLALSPPRTQRDTHSLLESGPFSHTPHSKNERSP